MKKKTRKRRGTYQAEGSPDIGEGIPWWRPWRIDSGETRRLQVTGKLLRSVGGGGGAEYVGES